MSYYHYCFRNQVATYLAIVVTATVMAINHKLQLVMITKVTLKLKLILSSAAATQHLMLSIYYHSNYFFGLFRLPK